jgi:PAS domain S-box-containing protein
VTSEEPTLTPLERSIIDSTTRLVAGCAAGFDAALLDGIRDVLLEAIECDGLAITVEDEGNGTFRLLWRSTVGEETGSPIAIGERREHAPAYPRFARPPSATRPRVVEDARASELALARAAAKMGILSYVMLPILQGEQEVGWLVVAHRVPGAPSQKSMPLLVELAHAIAPAVLRARTAERQRVMGALIDGSPYGMIALDPAGAVIEANAPALRLLALPRQRAVGKPLRSLVDEATFGKLLQVLLRRASSSDQPPTEIELAGGPVDVHVTRLWGLPEGSLLLNLCDSSARKAAAESAARRIEHAAFLRALSEAMAGAVRADAALTRAVDICFVRFELGALCGFRADDKDTLRLVASHGASAALAAKLDSVTDRDLLELFGEPLTFSTLKRVLEKTGLSLPGDPAGEGERWLMFVPLFHARRRLGGLLLAGHAGDPPSPELRETWEPIANTISVALRAAGDFERVVALEAEKRQLVDNLPVIVARLDPQTGATLFINAAIDRILGVRAGELGAVGVEGLLADDLEREASRAARARAAAGVATGWEDRRYRHADGRVLTLRESVYPVLGHAHPVHAVEIIAYDITTEIDARKQLMQSDRLASLGVLAAGVAHEINNPVAFISLATGQMNRLIDQAKRGEPGVHDRLREMAGEVTEAAAHIAEIVAELKLFTRIPEGASACPVDVNRMLQTALTLTSAEVRRHARIDVQLGPLPLAPGGFAGMGHVFANLLINAAQAIESKRETATAPGVSREPDVVRVSSGMEDGAIVVRITDTGVAIDGKMLPRIFDPFFETRSGGHGAGLGLSIAYDLVRRVGGDIRVVSSPGAGTSFEIVLPLEPALLGTDVPATSRPGPRLAGDSSASRSLSPLRRVLIIDDERPLVKALARQLSDRYEVDTALTATDALAQLSVNAYDAIVCDLRLPEQSGPAIYDEVVSRSPEQASRFIFTTGGTYGALDDEPHARAAATGLPLLEKPFDGASFEAAVERVASRPG